MTDRTGHGPRLLFLKALGYRLLSIVVTTLVALALVDDFGVAASIGLIGNILKFGMYYGYEWAWHRRVPANQ